LNGKLLLLVEVISAFPPRDQLSLPFFRGGISGKIENFSFFIFHFTMAGETKAYHWQTNIFT
jgi:hypothetical protein